MTQNTEQLWDVVLDLRGRLAVAEHRIDQLEDFIREKFDEPSRRRRRQIGFITEHEGVDDHGGNE